MIIKIILGIILGLAAGLTYAWGTTLHSVAKKNNIGNNKGNIEDFIYDFSNVVFHCELDDIV